MNGRSLRLFGRNTGAYVRCLWHLHCELTFIFAVSGIQEPEYIYQSLTYIHLYPTKGELYRMLNCTPYHFERHVVTTIYSLANNMDEIHFSVCISLHCSHSHPGILCRIGLVLGIIAQTFRTV